VQVADLLTLKSPMVDYQTLGPLYTAKDLSKNKHQLNMTDMLNAILQMAHNKVYIPLLMLMTATLIKIHSNDNLKYFKIPFGNGIRKQSIDESSFPTDNSFMETTFFQSYRNWLTIIDMTTTPEIMVGFHSRMLHDEHFPLPLVLGVI